MSRRSVARAASCAVACLSGLASAFAGLILVTMPAAIEAPGIEAPGWMMPAGIFCFVLAAVLVLAGVRVVTGREQDESP